MSQPYQSGPSGNPEEYNPYAPPADSSPGYYPPPPPPPGYGGYSTPGYGPQGPKPDNYLAWAIVATVLCCLPFGIVSIVYAAKVDGLWMQGDTRGAAYASENAKRWAIISAIVGIVASVAYIIFSVFIAGVSSYPNSY